MTAYLPRLAGWKRSDIQRISDSDRALLGTFVTQLILAGYGTIASLRTTDRDVHGVETEQLYKRWIPTIYSVDVLEVFPAQIHPGYIDIRGRLTSLFQHQYEKVLRLRIGVLGKVKFLSIASAYFDAGALLSQSEWAMAEQPSTGASTQHEDRAAKPTEIPYSIIEALSQEDDSVVEPAVAYLNAEGTRYCQMLSELLSDGHQTLSTNAARALGVIGGPGIDALVDALKNDDPMVRQSALIGLAWSYNPPTQYFAHLIADPEENVRVTAAVALSRQGARGLFYFVHALNDPDSEIRFVATNGIMALIDDLAENLHHDDPGDIGYVFEMISSSHWSTMLVRIEEHSADPDFRVRTNAAVIKQRAAITSTRLHMLHQ